MALTRRESDERKQAVIRFFIENPRATGEEAQAALTSGRLTGRQGQPPMGLGMLFGLQRQAREMAAKGIKPTDLPAPALPVQMNGAHDSSERQFQALRECARELQNVLSQMPETVLEVNVTRERVRVVRMQKTAEEL